MRRRLPRLPEPGWRVLDRLFVAFLIAVAVIDLSANSNLRGPLWLNIARIVPWLAGRTIRNQTVLARELAEKAERAEHARETDERRAIALERSRIARELHDVLAHNLSVMVVQASAARR